MERTEKEITLRPSCPPPGYIVPFLGPAALLFLYSLCGTQTISKYRDLSHINAIRARAAGRMLDKTRDLNEFSWYPCAIHHMNGLQTPPIFARIFLCQSWYLVELVAGRTGRNILRLRLHPVGCYFAAVFLLYVQDNTAEYDSICTFSSK